MKGNCENCANRATCKKSIGFMFGFCNTDFVPEQSEEGKEDEEENHIHNTAGGTPHSYPRK